MSLIMKGKPIWFREEDHRKVKIKAAQKGKPMSDTIMELFEE